MDSKGSADRPQCSLQPGDLIVVLHTLWSGSHLCDRVGIVITVSRVSFGAVRVLIDGRTYVFAEEALSMISLVSRA